jgi:RNA polymerase sigma-70 factor (ECF subfamily)
VILFPRVFQKLRYDVGLPTVEIAIRGVMGNVLANQAGEKDPDSSIQLLARIREGDADALNQLIERHLPALQRWARGRLPYGIRDLEDTADLVQETVIQALRHLDHFEYRREGALQAYLRQAVYNRIRMEFRRKRSRPQRVELDAEQQDDAVSPLEEAVGHEALERYERALARLKPEDRETVVTKIELDCSYAELARALGKPSADAARMALGRALLRLAEEMKSEQRS